MTERELVLVVVILSLLMLLSCTRESKVLQVEFQDFFLDDTVSLSIMDCQVFSKWVLNSDPVMGVAKVVVEIPDDGGSLLLRSFRGDSSVACVNSDLARSQPIELIVTVNGKTTYYSVDPTKGAFVGFDKTQGDSLHLNQRSKPFEYD